MTILAVFAKHKTILSWPFKGFFTWDYFYFWLLVNICYFWSFLFYTFHDTFIVMNFLECCFLSRENLQATILVQELQVVYKIYRVIYIELTLFVSPRVPAWAHLNIAHTQTNLQQNLQLQVCFEYVWNVNGHYDARYD